MQPELDLKLPRQRNRPWIAVAVSVLLHILVLVFGWVGGRTPSVPRPPRQLILLAPPSDGPDQIPMTYNPPEQAEPREARDINEVRPRVPGPGPRPRQPELRTRTQAVPAPPEQRETARARADTGAGQAAPRQPSFGRIGPDLARGRLWVRPLPLPPRELAQRLSRSRAELVDSAVTAIVQAYLDSIASDPANRDQGLPSWTTEIAGKKFGLDSRNIYIAGLKIPAAVLALLPIPSTGNIDQNRAYNHLMDLRGDLLHAARRAETMEEFKQAIREIRERKEREREFERNQRTAPEPEQPPVP